MNIRYVGVVGSILLAMTLVSGTAVAGKGNGGGRQVGGYGSSSGAMYGSAPANGYGLEQRNSNQYQYRHQHRNQYGNAGGSGNGNAWSSASGAGSDKSQYSDDRHLNQEDFQAWLNQNQKKQKDLNQYRSQQQVMTQDGL